MRPTMRVDTSPAPASSASPAANSPGPRTPTGRPGLWNSSTERQISRLYVYTTLPLQKIVEVVHRSPDSQAPKVDSAHKRLNALLDKEPRWLHPRNETDMSRRLNELSHSPSRSTVNSRASSRTRPHSASDPQPLLQVQPGFKREGGTSPTTLGVPPFHQYPVPNGPSIASSDVYAQPSFASPSGRIHRSRERGHSLGQHDDNGLYQFLRQTTFMSSSTDQTTGSFHRVLGEYSEPYIQTVKRLVKRFTAPINPRIRSMSPISEDPATTMTWLNDEDAPEPLPNRPHFLPGQFLVLDQLLQQTLCIPETEEHQKKTCYCFVQPGIQNSPWIIENSLKPHGRWLLQHGIAEANLSVTDEFGNTVLHFIAARGNYERLFEAVQSSSCSHLLTAKNTAGQTFLHVLCRSWLDNLHHLDRLLQFVARQGADLFARDNYGRNIFHMMISEDVFPSTFAFLQNCDRGLYAKRDAFNLTPELHYPSRSSLLRVDTQAMDLDPPQRTSRYSSYPLIDPHRAFKEEARLAELVRCASEMPQIEDDHGRNGLHCLAALSLNKQAAEQKHDMDRGRKEDAKNPDASKELLEYRLQLLDGLLQAGVDPNHYDVDGNTPLMAFAAQLPEEDDYKITPKILEALIRGGANVNARNRAGETALHIAVRCGRKLAMRTLQMNGANVHVRDGSGRSLLEVADVKISSTCEDDPKAYAHFEACRAWLSGKGLAVQNPTVIQEWGTGQ